MIQKPNSDTLSVIFNSPPSEISCMQNLRFSIHGFLEPGVGHDVTDSIFTIWELEKRFPWTDPKS